MQNKVHCNIATKCPSAEEWIQNDTLTEYYAAVTIKIRRSYELY